MIELYQAETYFFEPVCLPSPLNLARPFLPYLAFPLNELYESITFLELQLGYSLLVLL